MVRDWPGTFGIITSTRTAANRQAGRCTRTQPLTNTPPPQSNAHNLRAAVGCKPTRRAGRAWGERQYRVSSAAVALDQPSRVDCKNAAARRCTAAADLATGR